MIELNNLLLLSGNDIPFIEGQLTLRQPKLKEIAFLGEDVFYLGCQVLAANSAMITSSSSITDFQTFITILQDKNSKLSEMRAGAKLLMNFMIPDSDMIIENDKVTFSNVSDGEINNQNFSVFKNIITEMFCLDNLGGGTNYNPGNDAARKIANKFYQGRKKLAELKNQESQNISILNKFISILAVGQKYEIPHLFDYTIYQLFDSFARYQLKEEADMIIRAKMAGAKDLDDPPDWTKDFKELTK